MAGGNVSLRLFFTARDIPPSRVILKLNKKTKEIPNFYIVLASTRGGRVELISLVTSVGNLATLKSEVDE